MRLEGKRVLILGGTGAVGRIAGVLCAVAIWVVIRRWWPREAGDTAHAAR